MNHTHSSKLLRDEIARFSSHPYRLHGRLLVLSYLQHYKTFNIHKVRILNAIESLDHN